MERMRNKRPVILYLIKKKENKKIDIRRKLVPDDDKVAVTNKVKKTTKLKNLNLLREYKIKTKNILPIASDGSVEKNLEP
tara:strand:+ start:602 stop:841 length:240 start_codon:yes stop_codon:yes gene_type:complete